MSYDLKKSEWFDILSTIHDKLESIEAKSFKEMKEDFEVVMLEMQKELEKGDKGMIKVYFKEIVDYYYNGCSCCEPMETTNYTLVDYPSNLSEDLHNRLMDSCRDTSEQYRCLVNTSYVFSNTSLEYYEYVDWCYNLFNYEQMEELLQQDGVEVVFV